jgi:hypothetical protein
LIPCNCPHARGIVAKNMCGHDQTCPEYFAWAARIVFKKEHEYGNQQCPGCLPAWESQYRNMVSSISDFHARRDACETLHVEIAAEKPQFDQIMVAYCCDGCGAHGAQGVEGAFREKVKQTREANRVEGSNPF